MQGKRANFLPQGTCPPNPPQTMVLLFLALPYPLILLRLPGSLSLSLVCHKLHSTRHSPCPYGTPLLLCWFLFPQTPDSVSEISLSLGMLLFRSLFMSEGLHFCQTFHLSVCISTWGALSFTVSYCIIVSVSHRLCLSVSLSLSLSLSLPLLLISTACSPALPQLGTCLSFSPSPWGAGVWVPAKWVPKTEMAVGRRHGCCQGTSRKGAEEDP